MEDLAAFSCSGCLFEMALSVCGEIKTSATQTADKLKHIFATHGLLVTLMLDNKPPFLSEEFRHFMTSNGITHCRVPPYHPNGMAENMVKSP